ncbi:hypothetical protein [Halioxenophilus aromaticivorans]|uniref:Uncharacterized protein n=1 Tax=Halioxenophilus aromaticivorans TaxID=1306992 RepID=A0AAV3TY10_9ALTE
MQEICPNPLMWNKVYSKLKKAWVESGGAGEQPPKPLVVDLWAYSSDHEKAERWQQTLSWALNHSCYSVVADIATNDMYTGAVTA